tara:strand:+ start:4212 stop:4847 length:636 start_codon:yes stop_codon:yes gene_type:complete
MKEPFKILKPIPESMHKELVNIYNRCTTYILHFATAHEKYGEMICDQIWAETDNDQQWIHDNILPYYGLTIDNIAELDYSNKQKNDRSDSFSTGFEPPYSWSKNGINFTRWVAGEAKSMLHHDKAPHIPSKLNIPVINTEHGTIYYPEFDLGFDYKNRHTCLMNVQYKHDILGLEKITSDRAFLSVPLLDETKIDHSKFLSMAEYHNATHV